MRLVVKDRPRGGPVAVEDGRGTGPRRGRCLMFDPLLPGSEGGHSAARVSTEPGATPSPTEGRTREETPSTGSGSGTSVAGHAMAAPPVHTRTGIRVRIPSPLPPAVWLLIGYIIATVVCNTLTLAVLR